MKLPIITCFALLVVSCSKKETAPVNPKVTCRIATATFTGSSYTFTYTLNYDDSGRLIKLVYDGPSAYTKTFVYSDKMIYTNLAGINSAKDTIILNDAGRIASITESTTGSVNKTSFAYDANGQVYSSTTQKDNNLPVTISYLFTNSDLTNTITGGVKDTTTYSPDSAVIGNLDDFNQLIYFGSHYFTNKHLKTGYSGTPFYYTYSYTFDAEGKITNINSSDGHSTETYAFTYLCK